MNAVVHLPGHPEADGGLGLRHDPFRGQLDDTFYFDEAVREKRLNLLLHLAPYSDIVLVTGELGSGKTCMLQRLLARVGDSWRVCSLQATAEIGGERLLEILQKEFSLRPDDAQDHDQRVRLLRESLHALRHNALVPVLVIDDAHLLPHSALALIAALTEPWQAKDKVVSVVLFGDPDFDKKLVAPGLETLRSRINHTFDIPPLSEEETGRYIRRRMDAAGIRAGNPFTDSVIKFIHVASRGFPGRINEFARVVLQNSVQKGVQAGLPSSLVARHGAMLKYGVAAVLVALAAATLLYREQLFDRSTAPMGELTTPATAPGTSRPAPGGMPGTETDPMPLDSPPATAVDAPQSVDVAAAGEETAVPPEQDLTVSLAPPSDEAATPVPEGDVGGQAAGVSSVLPDAETAPAEATPLADGAGETTEAAKAEEGTAAPVAGGVATDSGRVETPAADPAPATAASPYDEDWLLSQDPASYTLQLLVASRSQCQAYIDRLALGDAAALFQVRSAGQSFYTLVYGVFLTEADAIDAGKALSEQDVKAEPWVRRLSAVQDRIREFRAAEAPPRRAAEEGTGTAAPQEIRREPWLRGQSPDAYTLQLFAGKEANVLDYLGRHALKDKVALFQVDVGGDQRLAVAYGIYSSRSEALEAATGVAAQLPGVKPWARSLRDIQSVLSPQPGPDMPAP